MALYLVTGGAGFIGSNIVERLVASGEQVRVIDDLSSGRLENLEHVKDEIEFIEGTICDAEATLDAVRGADYVLHLAARPSVMESINQPELGHRANIDGTFNVMMAAREAGVKRLVFSSSAAVYGNSAALPSREDFRPGPLSGYAVAKVTGEYYAKVFAGLYGLPTVVLRYFNVFGQRQNPDSQYSSVIPKFISLMLQGERPTIFGDGEQSRDFVHVENIYRANMLACRADGVEGGLFNVAAGQPSSVNDLAMTINRLLGTNIEPEYAPERPGEVKHSAADISRARELLGFEPAVRFEEGLAETIKWYRNR